MPLEAPFCFTVGGAVTAPPTNGVWFDKWYNLAQSRDAGYSPAHPGVQYAVSDLDLGLRLHPALGWPSKREPAKLTARDGVNDDNLGFSVEVSRDGGIGVAGAVEYARGIIALL